MIYENFFRGCQTGKYLEIGGRDGLDGTNTLFFERELNWTGMMIEACPQAYLQMVKNRSEKNNIFINGIISNSNPFTLTKLTSFGAEACSSVATVVLDKSYHSYWLTKKRGKFHTHHVMQIPLQPVFDAYSFTAIDFFSLDVEGHELQVLNSINFLKTKIGVRCLLEHLGYSGTNDGQLNDIFWSKGIRPTKLTAEDMCHGFVRNGLNWCSLHTSEPYCNNNHNYTSKRLNTEVMADYYRILNKK
ncbi:unnamed protein product [Bathycoccus prasinos]